MKKLLIAFMMLFAMATVTVSYSQDTAKTKATVETVEQGVKDVAQGTGLNVDTTPTPQEVLKDASDLQNTPEKGDVKGWATWVWALLGVIGSAILLVLGYIKFFKKKSA